MGKRAKKKDEGTFLGKRLISAAEDALQWQQEKKELRITEVTVVPPPEYSKAKIKAIRKSLNVSQPVFAGIIGCSPGAVKAWEQGLKSPNSAARRLLQVLSQEKELAQQFVLKKVSGE